MSQATALTPSDVSGAPRSATTPVRVRAARLLRVIGRWCRSHKLGFAGLVVIVALTLFSFVGPLIYHTDQVHTHLTEVNLPPSAIHPLGTDNVGYDILGRLMEGGQSSLEVGFAAALLASCIGTLWGAISGYVGGWVDALMMRVVDSAFAIPPLLLLLLLGTIFTPSVPELIVVLGLVSWLITARLVRGDSLSLRTREYVQAAMSAGAKRPRVVVRHVIPNALGTIVVQSTFEVANAILLLASLSFLGLGPAPPAANWGAMLSNGLNYIYAGYWWQIYPAGLAIVITVLAFNMLAESVRDSFETRLARV
ncbi:MAG: ABC transporter permease [Actinomycetota bacterium]|nr:ABC transporter permease [Actinomycetota bacterium]